MGTFNEVPGVRSSGYQTAGLASATFHQLLWAEVIFQAMNDSVSPSLAMYWTGDTCGGEGVVSRNSVSRDEVRATGVGSSPLR